MTVQGSRLSPETRREHWERLARQRFQVLVVGGGVTGAGVALDAATRGLDVALVEARDYASGTSSRSSKLVHGGLRYLERFDFSLVREALRERELLLTRLAPHLVKPVSFLYPLTHRGWERPYVTAGLTLYDTMGGARSVPRHRQLTRRGARQLCPALKPDALVGAVLYSDALVDDARHTLTVVRTAASYGATVLNSAEAVSLLRAGERVVGATVRDAETGATTDVRADVVVNATGVWTDEVQRLAGGRGRFHVRASKGVHVVVARNRINSEVGLILRTPTSVLFVIPWGDHWIVGTTDTDWELDLAHPAATRRDVDYLLERVNEVLTVPLERSDIEGVYTGLRPLLAGESEETSQLSREHAVARPQPGLITIAGGKYTTYRVMACDGVDAAAVDVEGTVGESVTALTPLVGADGYQALANQAHALASRYGLQVWEVRHLLDRYGSLLHEVLAVAKGRPELLDPVPGAEEYLQVELVHAASHEGALHLDDVLTRRTRISIETAHRGSDSAQHAAELVAPVLGWSPERVAAEVDGYRARVAAERRAEEAADDAAADAVRTAVPDSREALATSG